MYLNNIMSILKYKWQIRYSADHLTISTYKNLTPPPPKKNCQNKWFLLSILIASIP
jgi:hypothetical protein